MDLLPYETAKKLISESLTARGYGASGSLQVTVEQQDDASVHVLFKSPSAVNLDVLCVTLSGQLGKVTHKTHNGNVFFTNGDADLRIWYWLSIGGDVDISRKNGLTRKDVDLATAIYTVLNTSDVKQKSEAFVKSVTDELTKEGAIVYRPEGIDWDALSGYQDLKNEIRETIILRMKHPGVYENLMRRTRKRYEAPSAQTVLFEGPSGTGKTTMGRIIASTVNCPFIYLPFENIRSKWYGDSEKNLGAVFDHCASLDQSVLFLDEIDTLVSSRDIDSGSDTSSRITGVLLRKMDGFKKNNNVLVIGTTNRVQDLDPALKSRFKRKIRFELPNCVERAYIFEAYAQHLSSDDVVELARITDGFSGRDILHACQATEERWARAIIEGKAKEPTPSVETYKGTLERRIDKKEKIGF